MIKLLDIIEEGTLILTPEERQQVEDLIPEIIRIISEPNLIPSGQYRNVGTIKYKFADKEDGEAIIGVGSFTPDTAKGVFMTYDPNNRTDNLILIQQSYFRQFFPSNKFAQKDQELYRTFTGNVNTGIERLRQTIKHELIHAKDPASNHHYLNEPYDDSGNDVYFKSWAEFQTFTGQFFESLISGTDRVLSGTNTAGDLKRIESALSNILQFFAGKTKTLSIKTSEFIEGTGSRNIFQKVFNFVHSITTLNLPKSSDFALSEYIDYLNLIKKHNPEGYKEFLKDLYKTIKSIEEKVNSVSPMKIKVQEMKQNINEVKRMQLLAGLITESQLNEAEEAEQAAEKGLASFEDQLQAFAKTVKPSPKDKKLDEFEPASTLFSLVVGAPGLLTFLGKGADAIGNYFSGGAVKKNMIGQALQKAGHKLEHAYIDGIASILTGFFPETYAHQDPHDESSVLHDHAHAIYAALVGAAAIVSGIGATHATGVVQAVEAGASGLKTAEVIALAQKIAAA